MSGTNLRDNTFNRGLVPDTYVVGLYYNTPFEEGSE